MSYILDALKRADAQRESQAFPGMNAAAPRIVYAHGPAGLGALPLFGLALALSVALLGPLAWWLSGPSLPPQQEDRSELPARPAEVALATAPSSLPPTESAPAQPATPPAKATPVQTAAPRKPVRPLAVHVEKPAAKNPPAAAERSYARADLPSEVQRELPALTVSGSTYSENPAYRMLLINGQLVHEGEAVAPGLSLEQIQPKRALLKFQGYRYWMNY